METGSSQGGSPLAADDALAASTASTATNFNTRNTHKKLQRDPDPPTAISSYPNGNSTASPGHQDGRRKIPKTGATERPAASMLERKTSIQQKRPAPTFTEEKKTKTLKRATSGTCVKCGKDKRRCRHGEDREESISSSDDSGGRDHLMGLVSRISSGTPSASRSPSDNDSPEPHDNATSPNDLSPGGEEDRTPRQGSHSEMQVEIQPGAGDTSARRDESRTSKSPHATPSLPSFSTLDLSLEQPQSTSQLQLRPFPQVLPSPPSSSSFQALHPPAQMHVPGFRPLEPQFSQTANHNAPNQQQDPSFALNRAHPPPSFIPCVTCGASLKDSAEAHLHAQKHQRPYKCGEPGCETHDGFTSVMELETHRAQAHKLRLPWPMEPPQISPSREQLRRQSMPAVAQHQYTPDSRSTSLMQVRNGDGEHPLHRHHTHHFSSTPHHQPPPPPPLPPPPPPPQLPPPHMAPQQLQQPSQAPQHTAHHQNNSQLPASDQPVMIPIASNTLSPPRPRSHSQTFSGIQQQASPQQQSQPQPQPQTQQQHQHQHQQPQHQQHQQQASAHQQQRIPRSRNDIPPCPQCGRVAKNHSDARKHQLQHTKPFVCSFQNCKRNTEGFMTVNDLERHKKAVHNLKPRVGSSIGYICSLCQTSGIGDAKWWPRLDNFKAHILRKHKGADMQNVIESSKRLMRPDDTLTIMSLGGEPASTSSGGSSQSLGLPQPGNYASGSDDHEYYISAMPQQHQMQLPPPSQAPNNHPASQPRPYDSSPSPSPPAASSQPAPSQPLSQAQISPSSQSQLPPPSQTQTTPQHTHAQLPPLHPATSGTSTNALGPVLTTTTSYTTAKAGSLSPKSRLTQAHSASQEPQVDTVMSG